MSGTHVEKSSRSRLSDPPASDQADAQRAARLEQIGARLAELAGAHRAEADSLIGELESVWHDRVDAAVRYRLRRVYSRLVEARVDSRVWLAIYLDTLGDDSAYQPGAELRFIEGIGPDEGSAW